MIESSMVASYWLLDAEFWILDPRSLILDTGEWLMPPCHQLFSKYYYLNSCYSLIYRLNAYMCWISPAGPRVSRGVVQSLK